MTGPDQIRFNALQMRADGLGYHLVTFNGGPDEGGAWLLESKIVRPFHALDELEAALDDIEQLPGA